MPMAYSSTLFEWDARKDAANRRKHGVAFLEAQQVFEAPDQCLEIFDEAHSAEEPRFITVGPSRARLLVVVWTEPGEDVVRIISARLATKRERAGYQRAIGMRQ